MTPSRPRVLPHGRELNHILTRTAEPPRLLPCARLYAVAHPPKVGDGGFSFNGSSVDSALLNFSVHDREFGDQIADGCADVSPSIGGGLGLHSSRMEIFGGKFFEQTHEKK